MSYWGILVSNGIKEKSPVKDSITENDRKSTIDKSAGIRRGLELATKNYDKLSLIFLKVIYS